MSELISSPDILTSRITAVRQALASSSGQEPSQIEHRVAASVMHLGLVARLLAPALAVVVLADAAPNWNLETIWWQDKLGGPYPLSVPARSTEGTRPEERLADWTTDGPIRELTDAVRVAGLVSDRVLWGNVLSAINSAASMIGKQRPGQALSAANLAKVLFAKTPHNRRAEMKPGNGFRRPSCCLIYRLALTPAHPRPAPETLCGDCILA